MSAVKLILTYFLERDSLNLRAFSKAALRFSLSFICEPSSFFASFFLKCARSCGGILFAIYLGIWWSSAKHCFGCTSDITGTSDVLYGATTHTFPLKVTDDAWHAPSKIRDICRSRHCFGLLFILRVLLFELHASPHAHRCFVQGNFNRIILEDEYQLTNSAICASHQQAFAIPGRGEEI